MSWLIHAVSKFIFHTRLTVSPKYSVIPIATRVNAKVICIERGVQARDALVSIDPSGVCIL